MKDSQAGGTWYREPYVWLVVFFPVLAIIGGIITAWLAVRSDDGLVVDDYYKRGLEINKTLARDDTARHFALEALVEVVPDEKKLRVTLQGNNNFSDPEAIALTFLHPTRDGLDRRITLRQISAAIYEADLPVLPADRWYLQIEADDWRLMQTLSMARH